MKMLFAIRHKPTGFFLPNPKGKGGNGGSFVEPVDGNEEVPRLFHKKQSAKAALTAWLRGHHYATWGYDDGDGFSWGSGQYVEDISVKPVPGRNKEDMEIVAFQLVECPQP